MFFFNPVFLILGLIFTVLPQMLVKSTFSKYSQVKAGRNMTGAQVAQSILNDAGVYNIRIEAIEGTLNDHYDPAAGVLRLSQDIYSGNSVAAFGVAAHEAGHAIQDNRGYLPMKLRAGILPAVQAGQSLGPILIMAGIGLRFFMHSGGFTDIIALIGIALYGAVVLFHFVTLPVELDASGRGLKALAGGGYLEGNEVGNARKVLTAAALTYIAVALYALIELLYWIWILFGNRNRD